MKFPCKKGKWGLDVNSSNHVIIIILRSVSTGPAHWHFYLKIRIKLRQKKIIMSLMQDEILRFYSRLMPNLYHKFKSKLTSVTLWFKCLDSSIQIEVLEWKRRNCCRQFNFVKLYKKICNCWHPDVMFNRKCSHNLHFFSQSRQTQK